MCVCIFQYFGHEKKGAVINGLVSAQTVAACG